MADRRPRKKSSRKSAKKPSGKAAGKVSKTKATRKTGKKKAKTAKRRAAKTTAKQSPRKKPSKRAEVKPTPRAKASKPPVQPRQTRGAGGPTGMLRVLRDDGSTDRDLDPRLSESRCQDLYRAMVQVREFDRRMLVLQRQGRIGFYGPILGQEAATVGSVAAAEDRDWIFPALREGAAAMMRGLTLTEAVAQLIGNALDRCKGRQMPCHYTYREGNYHAMSSVIGTQISHAVGAAMASRIRGDDVVVLGYLGDGATSANDFHAGMNFAGVFRCPAVLICQNNQWSISVPVSKQSASETLAEKGLAYGIPAVRVDGNDVLAVYAATREAVARARAGDGPTFIEAVTYRRLGHSSSDDPTRYRDEAEVEDWARRDPVDRFRRYLEQRGIWDPQLEERLLAEIADAVNAAIAEAEAAKPPPPDTLITDVFAEPTAGMREMLAEALSLQEKAGALEGEFPL